MSYWFTLRRKATYRVEHDHVHVSAVDGALRRSAACEAPADLLRSLDPEPLRQGLGQLELAAGCFSFVSITSVKTSVPL